MGTRQSLNLDGTLTCRVCGVAKSATVEFFPPVKIVASGIGGTCRLCMRRYHGAWKRANANRIAPRRRLLYRERHASEQERKRRERADRAPILYRAKLLRQGMRDRSRQFGLAFDDQLLTVDYLHDWIVATPFCPCCGKAIDYTYKHDGRKSDRSPSIDRIFPELGYTQGNVALICWRCNNLKRDATPDELEVIARWMRSVGSSVPVSSSPLSGGPSA